MCELVSLAVVTRTGTDSGSEWQEIGVRITVEPR